MLTIIDGLLDAGEARVFRQKLEASSWIDGKATAGALAEPAKLNRQIPESAPIAVELGDIILRKLGIHPLFISAALPEKIYPPRFNQYGEGEHFGIHVDSPIMRAHGVTIRTDISATLFLTDPAEYEGGLLTIETDYGAQEVKLNAGDMVIYPARSLHRVTPVTRGARISAFFWIQSMVADDGRRSILFDLDQSIQALRAVSVAHDEVVRLSAIYNNLLRRWAVV